MNSDHTAPAAVRRVAEIASLLAEDRPSAKQLVKELFARFLEVQEHYRHPQPIESAPRELGASIQLYCPDHGGWHYGEWWTEGGERWVATIDDKHTLVPSHWRPGEPSAMASNEQLAWVAERTLGPSGH
jgi:hypothetical protein